MFLESATDQVTVWSMEGKLAGTGTVDLDARMFRPDSELCSGTYVLKFETGVEWRVVLVPTGATREFAVESCRSALDET